MSALLLSDIFPPKTGGTGRLFWEIYRRLPREAFAIAAGAHPDAPAFDAAHNLRVARLLLEMRNRGVASFGSIRHYFRTARAVRRLCRGEGVRMIHAARPLSEGLVARLVKLRTGIPYCCFSHGEDINIARTSRELSWLTRRVLNGATAVFPSSAFARDLLRRDWGVPEAKMHLLHPGVDCSYFVPAARSDETRAKFGWAGRTVVLTAGRLQRRKGHDVFIEVVARLRERFPKLLYAIVGSGEERERLDALVKRHNVSEHVQFAGALDDAGLLAAYQQCDVFALPNRAVGNDVEGFGMVLLEAQACGRPVLAGASGGTAETLTPGETGVLVPCDGPDEPAAALAALLSDPARLERMGVAARARMEVTFDWPARAAEAARVFARVSGPLPASARERAAESSRPGEGR